MKSKNFGGRPRLAREIVRDKRVVTFLTASENTQLRVYAKSKGKSVSSTCHELLLAALNKRLG